MGCQVSVVSCRFGDVADLLPLYSLGLGCLDGLSLVIPGCHIDLA